MHEITFPWLTEPSLQKINDVRDISLANLVRDDMLALILKGDLVAGKRINEPDIASRLKVSRVPVREALRQLESTGLVVSRKNSGSYVRQLSPIEVRDLYQLRGLLDGFAGRCAANLPKAARNELVALLDGSIKTMLVNQRNVQTYYTENLRFHWYFIEATGNQQLLESYRGIVQKLHLSRLENLSQDMGIKASIAEHVGIVDALRHFDAARCELLMAHHVGDAYARLLSKIQD